MALQELAGTPEVPFMDVVTLAARMPWVPPVVPGQALAVRFHAAPGLR
jgi:hypothetical protein